MPEVTREQREAWRGSHVMSEYGCNNVRHERGEGRHCTFCEDPWPCSTITLLDALETVEQELASERQWRARLATERGDFLVRAERAEAVLARVITWPEDLLPLADQLIPAEGVE